ncbi:TIR domain-containing protein [Thermodesulfobacteriota bacterium]
MEIDLVPILADAIKGYYEDSEIIELCDIYGINPSCDDNNKPAYMRLARDLIIGIGYPQKRSFLNTIVRSLLNRAREGAGKSRWDRQEYHRAMVDNLTEMQTQFERITSGFNDSEKNANILATTEEVASIFHTDAGTIRKFLESGELDGFKLEDDWRVHTGSIVDFLKNKTTDQRFKFLLHNLEKPEVWLRELNGFPELKKQIAGTDYHEGSMGAFLKSLADHNSSDRNISTKSNHIPPSLDNHSEVKPMPDPKKVFVVHGRDERLRSDFFSFLRALKLQPIEWSEALRNTRKASPYIGEVLDKAFENVQAVIVPISPDDEVRLSPDLWQPQEAINEKEFQQQARPNVLFEAGMAFGRDPDRTLLIEVGQTKTFSDVAGRHAVRLSNEPAKRKDVAERLKTIGCAVSTTGEDWLQVGDFSINRTKPAIKAKQPSNSYTEDRGMITPPQNDSGTQATSLKLFQTIGGPGTGNGEFQFGGGSDANGGIFVDNNYLYVTDWNNARLQRLKLGDSNFWTYFDGVSDSGNLYSAVYVDKNGTMFIQGMGLLKKFDTDKKHLGDIVIDISNFCRFVCDLEGNIFAQSRTNRNLIKKYNPQGEALLAFGGFGSSDGKFNNEGWSADIVTDKIGNLYMLDAGGRRIQKFDNKGNFLKKWNVDIGGYSYMAIDENDRIYVVEKGYSLLNQYNTEGSLTQQYYLPPGYVSGGGSCIFVHQNFFFVSSLSNHNIGVFSLD